jgi:adenylate kinase
LVDYYVNWAKSGTAGAPQHVFVPGLGEMNAIRDQIFAALK